MSEKQEKVKKQQRTKKTKSLEPKKPKTITRDLHESDDPSDEEVSTKLKKNDC